MTVFNGRQISRRELLVTSAAGAISLVARTAARECDFPVRARVPRVDYHVHIGDGLSVERAIDLSKQRGLKFGLLQHAGVKEHGYAVSDDDELDAWVRSLDGKPVFKGIEAEGTDWMSAFSRAALAKLDYVQADPFAVPDDRGNSLQIWKPEFRPDNVQRFMDRYVDYHVQMLSTMPLDILAVPTVLPESLRADYGRLWTPVRTRRVIEAAVKFNVALEIDSRFRVPSFRFLETAKAAGATFAFGSNFQTATGLGDIRYGVDLYKRLSLTTDHFFCAARSHAKASIDAENVLACSAKPVAARD
jgi:histidinol phosphatase-like PHP family hydrolase